MGESANTPTPPAGGRLIRLARPSLVVLCGPAACGKSNFAARHFRSSQIVSSDQCRTLVSDDEGDQRFNEEAFSLVHFIVEKRISVNRLSVVDSTALTAGARRSLLSLARKYHVPCVLFLFHVPLEICLARDKKRERSVGAPTVEKQFQLFQEACRGVHQEGFDHVVEFREEEKDDVRIEVVFRPVKRPQVRPQTRLGSVRNSRSGRPRPHRRPESLAEPPAPTASPAPVSSSPAVSSSPDGPSPNESEAPESSKASAAAQETPQDEAGT
ncbi:MAG: AAA family ATPase [Acidobacteria bacterium]|nr:AAA family ATPase [Acidobacteriota bacterium]